ncbi:PIG-L family deacetylase [Saccharothrix australiensis]|uniref:GlcNAc-PI de-N-acetylase n=1 Tax=Saccharothrix australiensis TaxID=2072 RepID=A0A495W2M5_9PSEU|nr:PIG-L family deacetylase [Saccharothrix australiensis]RKT55951.1 GlcNAc-PI de-N-acetylase [Saccharothrix australiensis]
MRIGVALSVVTLLLGALSPPAVAAAPAAAYLNVVAHQDDDVLFMNPDVRNSIAARRPNTTVFLTAGEAFRQVGPGRPGDPPLAACRDDLTLDREDYARCRQLGARAAYARMAGVADAWTQAKSAVDTPAGRYWLEVHALTARPELRLVFLNIPEWGDGSDDAARPCAGTPRLHGASLYHLWFDQRGTCSMVPSGTVLWRDDVRNALPDRAFLVAVLRALYERYQPTVIRTQDPDPDPRYQDPAWLHDHSDHVIGARFAHEAARGYAGPGGRAAVRIVSHRNYNIATSPVNLDAGQRAEKAADYAAYDLWDAHSDDTGGYATWPQRMIHRHTTGTTWAGRNRDGRLQAFAVQGGRLATWWQSAGGWSSTTLATPGPLAPGVSVEQDRDGRLHVFARRLDTHEVITLAQQAPDAGFGDWRGLGSPNTGAAAAQVGTPVAKRGADGVLRVFVKNGGGGLSVRTPDGWQDAGGTGLQDGLAVGVDRAGGTDVFGFAVVDGVGRVRHWSAGPGGAFALRPDLAGFEPSGPPSVALNEDGRQDVFYRLAGDRAARVGHTWQLPDGTWTSAREDISSQGGVGAPAVVDAPEGVADSRVVVFTTNRGGGVSTTRQVAPNASYGTRWADLGGFLVGQPAALTDPAGRVVLFALDDRGGLLVRRQRAAGGTAGFDDWVAPGLP